MKTPPHYRLHMPSDQIQVYDEQAREWRNATGAELYREIMDTRSAFGLFKQDITEAAKSINRIVNGVML